MATTKKNLTSKLDREVISIVKRLKPNKYINFDGNITYSNLFSNKMFLIKIIQEGIPYSFFNLIQNYTPFEESEWAKFLDISTKSLLRYKQEARHLRPPQTEKVMEMAEVTHFGLDVFEDMEKFKLWLSTPSFSLGNQKPIDLLRDSYGKEIVISELTRINHGILS